MLKKITLNLLLGLILAASAFAQIAQTPEKGSAERTAIISALRVPVEKALKQKIQFSIQTIKTQGNWAFVNGTPQSISGEKPDYSKTEFQEAINAGAFDNNFQALLKKTGGKWKIVRYQIGCTDVCWLGWDEQYRAPKAIFPATE